MKLKPDMIPKKLARGNITVAVIGLGWMGLPLACLFAEAGAKVLGADKNQKLVDKLNRGESPFEEPKLGQLIAKHVSSGKLKSLNNVENATSGSEVIIIAVPTLVDNQKQADYTILESACKELGKGLIPGALVTLMSTVAPNVVEKIVKPIL